MSTKKDKAPVKVTKEQQVAKEAPVSKQVLGHLSKTEPRQQPLSPRAYLMLDSEAVVAAAEEVPWGYGSNLAAKLKGFDWALPCGAGITPDGMKLCITVPADAIVEGGSELGVPEPLIEAARFKAENPNRNTDREAHVTIAMMSRKPGIIHGTWTAWKLDTPTEGSRLDVLGRLFGEIGYKGDIITDIPIDQGVLVKNAPF